MDDATVVLLAGSPSAAWAKTVAMSFPGTGADAISCKAFLSLINQSIGDPEPTVSTQYIERSTPKTLEVPELCQKVRKKPSKNAQARSIDCNYLFSRFFGGMFAIEGIGWATLLLRYAGTDPVDSRM